jgi:hypothetical protein
LLTAPLVLLLPIARWAAVYLALVLGATGLVNLIPAQTEDGRLSDGVEIVQARARSRATPGIRDLLAAPGWRRRPDAASRLTGGCVLGVPEAEECLKQLPDDRRHQLLLPASARQALEEALALDPNADLVPEAAGMLGDGAPVLAASGREDHPPDECAPAPSTIARHDAGC